LNGEENGKTKKKSLKKIKLTMMDFALLVIVTLNVI